MNELDGARRVALYSALSDEVPTRALAAAVLASGRILLLPRLTAITPTFAVVDDLDALSAGRFGGCEPPRDAPVATPDARDLVLVPGLEFDTRGCRLGRGGGWYDRALPRGARAPLIFGVGFAFQIVPEVPVAAHDRLLDGMVSERGVLRFASRDRAIDSG